MIMAWRLTLHGLTLRSARVGTAAAAAKMSRSMVPFASLISTGLRLMNELRTFQRGVAEDRARAHWVEGRLAGP